MRESAAWPSTSGAARAPQVGFLRADAQKLSLHDGTVDAAVSIAVWQLIPNQSETLAEMARVLRPGGRLAVMVPTVGPATALFRLLPTFEDLGLVDVRAKTLGNFQWVRGKRH